MRVARIVSLTHHILNSLLIPELRRTVVWTKSNPTPWNEVKQDENVKMMSVNQKFEKRSALLLLFAYSFPSLTSLRFYPMTFGVLRSWKRDRL